MRRIAILMTCATLAAGAFVVVGSPPVPAQEDIVVRGMITPAAQDAIDNGLAFLARQQNDDGSFGGGGNRGNIAYTSLSGLAFMAGGHQPGRGKYGAVVRKTVENVLSLEHRGRKGYLP